MFTRGLVAVCLVFAMVSVVQADAVVTLTALTPWNAPNGYIGGTVVDFQVDVTQDTPTDIPLRLMQLDFAASHSALTFLGPDDWPTGPPIGDGTPEFTFDFSSTPSSEFFYEQFPNYPKSNIAFPLSAPNPFMLVIPAAGTGVYPVGTGQVQLPAEQATKMTYMLDALNAGDADPANRGATVNFGFGGADPITTWAATFPRHPVATGAVTGSALALTVVPEPATLALLALGGVAVLRRRRTA